MKHFSRRSFLASAGAVAAGPALGAPRPSPMVEVPRSGWVDAVIVGIGLNLNWDKPPDELAGIAVAASEVAGRPVDRDAVLSHFLDRFEEHYSALVEPGGWRGTLLNYRRLSATLGSDVRVELPGETFTGRAVEVTGEGHLLVDVGRGEVRRVPAGDVVHLRPV